VAFCTLKNFGTTLEGYCILELIKFPTLAIGKSFGQAAVWLSYAVNSRHLSQGLGGQVALILYRRGHPRLIVFSFVMAINHGVQTQHQLHCLLPHDVVLRSNLLMSPFQV